LKQCPNCQGNLADYVPACPYCGVILAAPAGARAQPAWSGPQQSSGKATASMVCGILFFLWPFTAIAAIVLGHLALSEIKRSAGRLAGHGMAMAGLILGYIGVAFVPFLLIIAAIALPNLLRAKMAANEASAVGTLRTYNTAMVAYASECPNIGYARTLENLGPGESETDKCAHAGLVGAQLATAVPVKSGYHFSYAPQVDGDGLVTKYALAAGPVAEGTSGLRHFFTDESGVIRYSRSGAADVNSEPLM
jgi:type IV pilus assembly protein PilA